MTYPVFPAAVAAAAFAATAAHASCGAHDVLVEIAVREAPIAMVQDIPLETLRTAAARLPQPPAHPVFGFYAATIGYDLRSVEVTAGDAACPRFRLRADLVAVDRRIAVASDLAHSSCRFQAALDHYRRHAAAGSLALHRLAADLPAKLRPDIGRYIESSQPTPDDARRYVSSLLETAIDSLNLSLPEAQRKVDTEDETQRLSAPCGAV